MRLLRTFKSAAFRLALVFAGVFAIGAVLLIYASNIGLHRYVKQSTATALSDEAALLKGEAALRGQLGVQQLIARRQRLAGARQFLYLLIDPSGRRLVGELPPSAARLGLASARVSLRDDEEAEEGPDVVTTFGMRLSAGSTLIVGRDADEAEQLEAWISRLLTWSSVGVVVTSLLAGYLIAAVFLGRLDRLGAAADRVMAGRPTERLPAVGLGEEFDRLSATLNRMLDRVEAAMEGLRQVSTDIAHDLRTPLSRLRQTLEEARAQAHGPEALQASMDHALAQTDEVLATFRALLRIGLIEGGTGRARFGPVDLSRLLAGIIEAYGAAAEDERKHLVTHLAPAATIIGDEELLTQMFVNLVENAIHHTGPGATIELSVILGGVAVVAVVADNGPGIPVSEAQNVLRRFYRLDRSRTSPGAGLGLAMVSAIAELHGIRLELLDNHPGLRVQLTIPADSPQTG